MMTRIANWGNHPVVDAKVHRFRSEEDLRAALANPAPAIARGLGRSYGDSSLAASILSSDSFNRFLAFDPETGVLTCESGVSIADILDVFVPRGWFPPVTPGTKFVTIGGAIAADVHGKNHHKVGCFGDHVLSMDIMLADGSIVTCSPTEHAELFDTTCGGMGLTGIILRATIRLKRIESAYIREEVVPAANLDGIMDLFEASAHWTYTVAWIDCLSSGSSLGRSIMMRGEHATAEETKKEKPDVDPLGFKAVPKLTVPFMLPSFLLNSLTVRAFNALYYRMHAGANQHRLTNFDTFFYPLDAILHWNRIYGRRGFTQYQVAFPLESSRAGLRELLEKISASGQGSFLAVLKLFGPQRRVLSFPREGYTLALDFPINDRVLRLFDELDQIVLRHGGRLYLAKDARVQADVFRKGYANANAFRDRIKQWDPAGRWQSLQSKRVGLTS